MAHLFLVRDKLNHENVWRQFFNANNRYYNVYVHAKWPHSVESAWLRERLIQDYCETQYATVSLVEAELLLLSAALRDDDQNQIFLLHSESCIPIRTFELTYQRLFELRQSWLDYCQGSMERYPRVNRAVIRRQYFYKSSQFFCLTREHAQVVLQSVDLNDWRRCWCPDEHCIPTTLAMHGKLIECVRRDLTFALWPPHAQSPCTFHILSHEHLGVLRQTPSLFARKFATDSDIAMHVPITS